MGNNKVAYVVGTGIDITDRKRIERHIAQAKREWERTFDAVPDLIAIVDQKHCIARVNRALAERLGREPRDLVGQPCCRTLHGLPCNPDWCLQRRAGADAVERESREPLLGGEFQTTVTPLFDADGAPAGSVHVFRDLAPLREADAARRRAELAKLDRRPLLGLLSVALAHELNQPLTAMRCNAQTALQVLEQVGVPARADMLRELLTDIESANRRAAGIITDMREIFEGRPPPAERLIPADVIHEAVRLLRGEAERRKISLCLDLAGDLRPVRAARIPILQVLLNTINNAFDAVEDQPVARRAVWMTAASDHGKVLIAVLDSGPGIATDQLDAIFEPLSTSKPNGMGMGLAICRSLLAAYGGTISAANRTEGGAVFTCALPFADQEGIEECIEHAVR